MLRAVSYQSISYDLVGLATRGIVTVGRETDSSIRLDSQEVPFLLSRKHGNLQFQPDGKLLLTDLNSTNGTYVSRGSMCLRKLSAGQVWELQDGDLIAFGGPETIVAQRSHVTNPFVFKYFSQLEEQAVVSLPTEDEDVPGPSNDVQAQGEDQSSNIRLRNVGLKQTMRRQETCRTPKPSATAGAASSSEAGWGVSPCRKMKEVLSAHLSCAICQDWLVACHALSCGHMFCGPCITQWLARNQSCPSCRKAVSGVPVRCFQVDNTINELLDRGISVMSPATTNERKQKQLHWETVSGNVMPDWESSMQDRKKRATEAALRNHRDFMVQSLPQASSDSLSDVVIVHVSGPSNGQEVAM